jgi:hypothetical protein
MHAGSNYGRTQAPAVTTFANKSASSLVLWRATSHSGQLPQHFVVSQSDGAATLGVCPQVRMCWVCVAHCGQSHHPHTPRTFAPKVHTGRRMTSPASGPAAKGRVHMRMSTAATMSLSATGSRKAPKAEDAFCRFTQRNGGMQANERCASAVRDLRISLCLLLATWLVELACHVHVITHHTPACVPSSRPANR